jgi:thioesterase domain-containing protein
MLNAHSELDYLRLVPLRGAGARRPLFCIAAPEQLEDLVAAMDSEQPIYGFRLPEWESVCGGLTVEQLAKIYLLDIRKIQQRGPYCLSGYSFGGLVAFEIATQLASEGEDICLLALLDTLHPRFWENLSMADFVRLWTIYWIDRLKKYSANILCGNLGGVRDDLVQFIVSRSKRVAWIGISAMARIGKRPIPRAIRNSELAIAAAWRQYIPRTSVNRLVLFRAEHRRSEYDNDITLGWRACAVGAIDVHTVPGDHETFLRAPYVSVLAEKLSLYVPGADDDEA